MESPGARHLPGTEHKTGTVKLDYIDSLRGIAALSIFFYHIYATIGGLTEWSFPISIIPERLIDLTLAGIPLFFIISSFTLYLSLDNRVSEEKKILKFYLRRLFRIAPLFYLLLIVVVLDALLVQKKALYWREVLSNFTFTFNLVPQYSSSLFSDGWTVGVEMLFYLVLPLIFITVHTVRRSIILFIGIYWLSKYCRLLIGTMVGENVMMSTNYFFYNFFHWAYIFPIGIICYLIYKSYLPKIKTEYQSPASLVMLSISFVILLILINNITISMALFYVYEPLANLTSLMPMSSLAFVLLILSLSLRSNRFIVNRFTRFYGTISYSLYLVHPFLITPLKPVYIYFYEHTIYSTDLSLFFCVLLTLLIVTPVSLLTYHLIEVRGIKWGKKTLAKL